MFDSIIIGGGPAAIAAGVYAARKKVHAAVVADVFQGQSVISETIENWIGESAISGLELAQKMENHLRAQKGIEIFEDERVMAIEKNNHHFTVQTESGKKLETKTVLVASGSRRRRLEIPGEAKFEGKGVVFCSTCDAPLFQGKDVMVVGSGNAAAEAVRDLLAYANRIYLMARTEKIHGDPVTVEKILKSEKLTVIYNAEAHEIKGKTMVSGFVYFDKPTQTEKEIAVQGVFVQIGQMPNSDICGDLVSCDEYGHIIVDPRTQKASAAGIWAAGDVADGLYHQNNLAAAEGIVAMLNINDYLHQKN